MNKYHPLKVFKYCPSCGNPALSANSEKSLKCSNCNFLYFINAAAAVAGIITDKSNKLLLAIRKNEPYKGKYDLPGGFIDQGERAEDALQREIKEELNLDIIELRYFTSFPNEYLYKSILYYTLDITYQCKVQNFSPILARDDISGFDFVLPEELNMQDVGAKSMKGIIKLYLQEHNVSKGE
jgi:8-oxo-dGTP pyrophosphatase MutT (NUDIX family)